MKLTALERIIEAIYQGNDYKLVELIGLLHYIETLLRTKKATLRELQTYLELGYSDFTKGSQDTQNTHL